MTTPRTAEERAAEFAEQRARAAQRYPAEPQYQARIGHLFNRDSEHMDVITRWGLWDLDAGEPVTDPDAPHGPATVTVTVAGEGDRTYTQPGTWDGPPPRLTDRLDDLHAWVRDLGGGVLHIGRQWYHHDGR